VLSLVVLQKSPPTLYESTRSPLPSLIYSCKKTLQFFRNEPAVQPLLRPRYGPRPASPLGVGPNWAQWPFPFSSGFIIYLNRLKHYKNHNKSNKNQKNTKPSLLCSTQLALHSKYIVSHIFMEFNLYKYKSIVRYPYYYIKIT
jgi:hypothetical protein